MPTPITNFGNTLLQTGGLGKRSRIQPALEINRDDIEAQNNLAWGAGHLSGCSGAQGLQAWP